MKRVLFVCVHNSGRSQMAATFLEEFAGGRVEVDSAGTQPSDGVNPTVVEVMKASSFSEPDCSPHPFDILAIYALYQHVQQSGTQVD